jgi:hypothetical protein
MELGLASFALAPDPDAPPRCPVGSIFVDATLRVIRSIDLSTLPYLIRRSLLECLIVIIHKYDLVRPPFRHLSEELTEAVKHVTESVLEDTSQDHRQLALSVAQGFLQRWPDYSAKILRCVRFSVPSPTRR